eukprot:3252-Heterococcus_DN1.PRE.1
MGARSRFTDAQNATMKAHLDMMIDRRDFYLDPDEKCRLSDITGMTIKQVTQWFTNWRTRNKVMLEQMKVKTVSNKKKKLVHESEDTEG